MKPETIKAIFTNLLFVLGVILLIAGFLMGTRTVVRLITFENYPLNTYEETKCENNFITMPAPVDTKYPEPSKEELETTKSKCKISLDMERKVRKTEDIVSSISLLVSGAALVYFFRKYILK